MQSWVLSAWRWWSTKDDFVRWFNGVWNRM